MKVGSESWHVTEFFQFLLWERISPGQPENDGDACMQGLWRSGSGTMRQSKGCVFDCNYSLASSPPQELEGERRRGTELD